MSDDHAEDAHNHHSHDLADVAVAVVTVSSTRNLDDDPAGDAIEAAIATREDAHLSGRTVVPDDREAIGDALADGVDAADAVVTTGGTGLSPDDVTVDVATARFDREVPGFGELFRRRSTERIGGRAMATRATAGVVDGTLVFCLPGAADAVELGADLLLPQVAHLAGLATR